MQSNQEKIKELEIKIKAARINGAMFHPTNPPDSWYCCDCGVFGRGETECWSCGSSDLNWQWVPRFGGGSQSTGPFEE